MLDFVHITVCFIRESLSKLIVTYWKSFDNNNSIFFSKKRSGSIEQLRLWSSNSREFVILEFQSVPHVDAEGQQGDGDFGDHAGVVVLDEGIVAADIDNGAIHSCLLVKIRPWFPRGESLLCQLADLYSEIILIFNKKVSFKECKLFI